MSLHFHKLGHQLEVDAMKRDLDKPKLQCQICWQQFSNDTSFNYHIFNHRLNEVCSEAQHFEEQSSKTTSDHQLEEQPSKASADYRFEEQRPAQAQRLKRKRSKDSPDHQWKKKRPKAHHFEEQRPKATHAQRLEIYKPEQGQQFSVQTSSQAFEFNNPLPATARPKMREKKEDEIGRRMDEPRKPMVAPPRVRENKENRFRQQIEKPKGSGNDVFDIRSIMADMTMMMGNNNNPYKCGICNERFTGQRALDLHMQMHSGGQQGTSKWVPIH